jgi:hypothetical protein
MIRCMRDGCKNEAILIICFKRKPIRLCAFHSEVLPPLHNCSPDFILHGTKKQFRALEEFKRFK